MACYIPKSLYTRMELEAVLAKISISPPGHVFIQQIELYAAPEK